MRQHFPDITVVSDDDVDALFPGLLGRTSLGPFHPVRGRWGWVLVQVLHLVAVSRLHVAANPVDLVFDVEREKPPVGKGHVWFIEPDVGWTETTSLPTLLQYATSFANATLSDPGHGDNMREIQNSTDVESNIDDEKHQDNLDFLGPGKCSTKDRSDAMWNSKGTWETASFRAQVQNYEIDRSGRSDEGSIQSDATPQDVGHLRRGISKSREASTLSSIGHQDSWRAHCQLQLVRMSQRLREVVWRDLQAGRVAYCEIHAPTAALMNGFTVASIPEEVLSRKFLAWEHVTEEDWRTLRNHASAVSPNHVQNQIDDINQDGGFRDNSAQHPRLPGGLFYHSLKF